MPSNHLILCRPLLPLPSIFPSIRVFSNELALHQVTRVLELQLQRQSFQGSPSNFLFLLTGGIAESNGNSMFNF